MKHMKLTGFQRAATSGLLERPKGAGRMMVRTGFAALGAIVLTGCINVTAPEEPIVIELNVNVRADVVYRLAEDAANTVEEYGDIF